MPTLFETQLQRARAAGELLDAARNPMDLYRSVNTYDKFSSIRKEQDEYEQSIRNQLNAHITQNSGKPLSLDDAESLSASVQEFNITPQEAASNREYYIQKGNEIRRKWAANKGSTNTLLFLANGYNGLIFAGQEAKLNSFERTLNWLEEASVFPRAVIAGAASNITDAAVAPKRLVRTYAMSELERLYDVAMDPRTPEWERTQAKRDFDRVAEVVRNGWISRKAGDYETRFEQFSEDVLPSEYRNTWMAQLGMGLGQISGIMAIGGIPYIGRGLSMMSLVGSMASESYYATLNDTGSYKDKLRHMLLYAPIGAALEYLPTTFLRSIAKPSIVGNSFFKKTVKSVVSEAATESSQSLLSDFLRITNDSTNVFDFGGAFEEGAIAGASTGILAALLGIRYRARTAEANKQQQQYFEAAAEAAKSIQAPEGKVGEYAEQISPVSTVWVSAEGFNQYFQSAELNPRDMAESIKEGTGQAFEEALAVGGKFAVDINDYVEKVSRGEHGLSLAQHTAFDPTEYTAAEAEEVLKELPQDVEKLQRMAERLVKEDEDYQVVYDDLYAQMTNEKQMDKKVAKNNALVIVAYYRALSQKTGETPAALYEKYPIKVGFNLDQVYKQMQSGEALFQGGRAVQTTWFRSPTIRFAANEGQVEIMPVPLTERVHEGEFGNDAKVAARDRLKEKVLKTGKKVSTRHLGEVQFSSDGIRKPFRFAGLSEDNKKTRASMLMHLPEILDNAVEIAQDETTPEGGRTMLYRYAVSAVSVNGENYAVRLVLQSADNGNTWWFHTAEAHPISAAATPPRAQGSQINEPAFTVPVEAAAPKIKLSDLVDAVKTDDFALFQGDNQIPRGMFTKGPDGTLHIMLSSNRNLSTFLHEAGHLFLHIYSDLYQSANCPPEIRKDMDILLDRFGVSGVNEIGREHHEMFAEMFELYLKEGRAPAKGLEAVFRTFKRWLSFVYDAIKQGHLDVELTDDVRGVMDRMLAAEEAGESILDEALFDTAESASMTEAEFALYQRMQSEIREAAKEDAMSASIEQMETGQTDDALSVKEKIREEVELQLSDKRANLAIEVIRGGGRLNRTQFVERFGEDAANAMPEGTLSEKDGQDVDEVAAATEYDSAEDMIRALTVGRAEVEAKINQVVEDRFAAEYQPESEPKAPRVRGIKAKMAALRAELRGLKRQTKKGAAALEKSKEKLASEKEKRKTERSELAKELVETRRSLRKTKTVAKNAKAEIEKLKAQRKKKQEEAREIERKLYESMRRSKTNPTQIKKDAVRIIARLDPNDLNPEVYLRAADKAKKEEGRLLARKKPEARFRRMEYELNLALYKEAKAVKERYARDLEKQFKREVLRETPNETILRKYAEYYVLDDPELSKHPKEYLNAAKEAANKERRAILKKKAKEAHEYKLESAWQHALYEAARRQKKINEDIARREKTKAFIKKDRSSKDIDQRAAERIAGLKPENLNGEQYVNAINRENEKAMLALNERRLKAAERYLENAEYQAALYREAMRAKAQHERSLRLAANQEYIKARDAMLSNIPSLSEFEAVAKAAVHMTKLMHLTPKMYLTNARRMSKKAVEFAAKRNFDKAMQYKVQELMCYAMHEAALNAQHDEQKMLAFFKKSKNRKFRERLAKGTTADYLGMMDAILSKYDFGKVKNKQLATREAIREGDALQKWLSDLEAAGTPVHIAKEVLDRAQIINYRELRIGELEALYDSLMSIVHAARHEGELSREAKRQSVESAATEISDRMRAVNPEKAVSLVDTEGDKFWGIPKLFSRISNVAKRPDYIAKFLDGSDIDAPFWKYIFQPIKNAETKRNARLDKAKKDIDDIRKKYYTEAELEERSKRNIDTKYGVLTMNEIIQLALNTGSPENVAALLESDKFKALGIARAELNKMLEILEKKDWDYVQDIWDYLETYWPEISSAYKKITGFVLPRAAVAPVHTKYGVYKGGYFPLMYEHSITHENSYSDLKTGKWMQIYAKASSMHERVGSGGRDVLLDPSTLMRHLYDVIHKLEMRDAIVDASKILDHKITKDAFKAIGREDLWNATNLYLMDMAVGKLVVHNDIQKAAGHLISSVSMAKMGFKLGTAVVQVSGIAPAAAEVGLGNVMDAISKLASSPEIFKEIVEKSPYMLGRRKNALADVTDAMSSDSPIARRFMDSKLGRAAFVPLMTVQGYVDSVVWLAALEKANTEYGLGGNEAIQYADRMVARTQGSGLFAERSALERGTISNQNRLSHVVRAFNMFGSYSVTKYNMLREWVLDATRSGDKSELFKSLMLGIIAEAVLTAALRLDWPDEDESALVWLGRQSLYGALGAVPVAGSALSGRLQGFSSGVTPVDMMAYDIGNAIGKIPDVVTGDQEDLLPVAKAWINVMGDVFGIPASQINQTLGATVRDYRGEDVSIIEYGMYAPE